MGLGNSSGYQALPEDEHLTSLEESSPSIKHKLENNAVYIDRGDVKATKSIGKFELLAPKKERFQKGKVN